MFEKTRIFNEGIYAIKNDGVKDENYFTIVPIQQNITKDDPTLSEILNDIEQASKILEKEKSNEIILIGKAYSK